MQNDLYSASINELTSRQAMGLPDHYVALSHEVIETFMGELTSRTKDDLVQIISSREAKTAERLAAGQLLGLLGDPRISTFEPSMCDVAGGRAVLGLQEGEVDAVVARYKHVGVQKDWILKETPSYEVDVLPFRIGKFPVTHIEFRDFLIDSNWHEIPSAWPFGRFPAHMANHPVYSVTEEAADAYAAWLRRKTGRNFRLPTEIEWEYAASDGGVREFPWGDVYESDRANTAEVRLFGSTPVGCFPAGSAECGALDMAGNVEEYVADLYRPYPGGAIMTDDLQVSRGTYRIARGGSFTRFADLARGRRRHGRFAKDIYVMGFRLAEDLG